MPICKVCVVCVCVCRYWGVIDDALRSAAYRNVSVRLMGSYWNNTDCDMLHFLVSLSDDSRVGYRGTLETVSACVES